MRRFPVRMPDLGGGAMPVLFGLWLVEPGDAVYAGDRLAEIMLSDCAATVEVSSPKTGVFCDPLTWPGDVLQTHQILGFVESNITDDLEESSP